MEIIKNSHVSPRTLTFPSPQLSRAQVVSEIYLLGALAAGI